QQLKDASRMLQGQVISNLRRQRGQRLGRSHERCSSGRRRSSWCGSVCRGNSASVVAIFVSPRRAIVGLRASVEARVQPIFRQLEAIFYDERGIGVVDEIVVCDAIVFDRVTDDSAEKRDIGPGPNLTK